jgi:Domain of Unknown Function (DUF349).
MSHTEFYTLRENKVFIAAEPWFAERVIATLPNENQQHFINAMIERFDEVKTKFIEIAKEFEESEYKINMSGKINRLTDYMKNVKAIGNFSEIFERLDQMKNTIHTLEEEILQKKESLLEQLKALLEPEDWKIATEKLTELQKEFKSLPIFQHPRGEEIKKEFEAIKDEFFKRKQAIYEAKDKEILENLDKKMELCEKAESLQHSTEWKKTTEIMNQLMEEWKKIGMVPKHRMEELWFRFNSAREIFFAKKKEHIEEIKQKLESNLSKKMDIIARANELKDSKDWKKTTDAFNALMEEWKSTGRVSAEKNEEIWQQFLEIKNHFFNRKDQHYNRLRMQLEDNYARKMAIVNHAESLKDTNDFETGTREYMEMIEEWKSIGRIPKEYGDELWERFQQAKKHFFDRKDAHREERKKELIKDIQERLNRNRTFFNRLRRDLQNEEELLFDVDDRLKNLPPTLRSYEKREEYIEMMEDIKEKINDIKEKIKEVKDKIYRDEREINYIMRGPKKREEKNKSTASNKTEKNTTIPPENNQNDNPSAVIDEPMDANASPSEDYPVDNISDNKESVDSTVSNSVEDQHPDFISENNEQVTSDHSPQLETANEIDESPLVEHIDTESGVAKEVHTENISNATDSTLNEQDNKF